MKTTTQKAVAEKLGLEPSQLCKMIAGKQRPSLKKAAELERITQAICKKEYVAIRSRSAKMKPISRIEIKTWLYGSGEEIKNDLERIFGRINNKLGRPIKVKNHVRP